MCIYGHVRLAFARSKKWTNVAPYQRFGLGVRTYGQMCRISLCMWSESITHKYQTITFLYANFLHRCLGALGQFCANLECFEEFRSSSATVRTFRRYSKKSAGRDSNPRSPLSESNILTTTLPKLLLCMVFGLLKHVGCMLGHQLYS